MVKTTQQFIKHRKHNVFIRFGLYELRKNIINAFVFSV